MADLNFFALLARCRQPGNVPPVIVLHGYYEFLGETVLQTLGGLLLTEKNDFSYRRFYFDGEEETQWEALLNEAGMANFFIGGRKIIVAVIREEKRLTLTKADRALLEAYVANPNRHTTLVIYVSLDILRDDYKQLRKGKIETLLKAVNGPHTVAVDLDRISESELRSHIKAYLKERGITITAGAVEKLLEIKGDDFISLIHQLPKLEAAAAHCKSLDTEDIDEIVTGITSHSIWDLSDAIENEDAAAYLEILQYLAINGIKPTFIIGTLIAYYHKIYTAKHLLNHHFPVADIGRVLQQPAFILNKFIRLVKEFPDAKLQRILRLIYRLDTISKTGGEDAAQVLLQNFIFQVKQVGR